MKVFVLYLLSVYSLNRMIVDSRVGRSEITNGLISLLTLDFKLMDWDSERTTEGCEQRIVKSCEQKIVEGYEQKIVESCEPTEILDDERKVEETLSEKYVRPVLTAIFRAEQLCAVFNFFFK